MWLWNDINIFRSANEIRETGQNRSRFSCNRQPNTIPNKDNYLPGTFTCKESETSQQHKVLIYHASLSEVVYYFFILEQDLQGLLERLSSLPDLSGVCDSRIVHLWFSVQCYVDHCLSVFCVVLCRSLSVRFLCSVMQIIVCPFSLLVIGVFKLFLFTNLKRDPQCYFFKKSICIVNYKEKV